MKEVSGSKESAGAVRHYESGFKNSSTVIEITGLYFMEALFQCRLPASLNSGMWPVVVHNHITIDPDIRSVIRISIERIHTIFWYVYITGKYKTRNPFQS